MFKFAFAFLFLFSTLVSLISKKAESFHYKNEFNIKPIQNFIYFLSPFKIKKIGNFLFRQLGLWHYYLINSLSYSVLN